MTTPTLFQTIATELYDAFRTIVLGHETVNGEFPKRYALKDDAPEWMTAAVQAAHWDDRFPDDWIYESCRDVAQAFSEYEEPNDETCDEVADRLTDVGNYDLLKWLAGHVGNAAAVDQA